jgi:hypothetical protein
MMNHAYYPKGAIIGVHEWNEKYKNLTHVMYADEIAQAVQTALALLMARQ